MAGTYVGTSAQMADGVIALAKLNALSTKGDLLGYSTLHARLGVGTDGQVLTADAASALGLKWAAPAGGVMTLVGDSTVVGADVSSISITSIPSGYEYLVGFARIQKDGTTADMLVRLNNDSANNYLYEILQGVGNVISADDSLASSRFSVGEVEASSMGMLRFELANSSTQYKPYVSQLGTPARMTNCGGRWADNTEVNRVDLIVNGASKIVAGSRLTIYGVNV